MLVAGALALAAVAFAGNGGIKPLEPNSPNAGSIHDAYLLILAITGAVFVVVEATLLTFIVRYRRGIRPRYEDGEQLHGATKVELAWTIGPVVLLTVVVAFVFYKLPGIENTPSAAAGDSTTVHVEGHQFYWLFRRTDGSSSINVLEVPVGRVVTLDLSANDVIHSWWVPELGGKIDTIPGKVNHTWFKAERPGTFVIRCAEFCGLEHANMRGVVRVLPEGVEPRRLSQMELGRQVVDGVCATCHGDQLQGGIGPPIAGSALFNDARGMRDLLRNGIRTMPAVGKTWDAQMLAATIAYLKSTAAAEGGTSGG
jgi:cytochrome c oxidase subunit II